MNKAPYTFPHRSRKAMVDYFMNRQSRSYHGVTYRFAWNVKAYGSDFRGPAVRAAYADEKLDPAFDKAWEAYIRDDENLFWECAEDAGRYISEGEWTSYPGDDQGDWDFSFAGRSGGWIVLEKWRGRDMRNPDRVDFEDMDFADLKALYRGIRCADSDFTPEKAVAEIMYQAGFRRSQWEIDQKAERDSKIAAEVAALELARPDLAPAYV